MSSKAINMASNSPSRLSDHLGYWLRAVSNSVSHAFAAKLAGRGVTVAEWVVLRSLHGRPPTAPSRLADELGMTRGAITKLADRLIAKSLLVRTPSADDGRAQTLELTLKGSAIVPELAALADRNEDEFFRHLEPADRDALERILKETAKHHRITAAPTT
jgi:DNA-binding MarR family transcriptional regulator